jgi:hypothetical protein
VVGAEQAHQAFVVTDMSTNDDAAPTPPETRTEGAAPSSSLPAPVRKKSAQPFRDEKGHFLKGNPGGPGAPPRRLDYLKTMHEVVDVEQWRRIVELARRDALNTKNANIRAEARRWLASFFVPDQRRTNVTNVAVAVGGTNGTPDLDRILDDPASCDAAVQLAVRLGRRPAEPGGPCLDGIARVVDPGAAPGDADA